MSQFPSNTGTQSPLTLQRAWDGAQGAAASIKTTCTRVISQIAAGPVSASDVINLCVGFSNINAQLTIDAALPGIVAYAQSQPNMAGVDVAGSFTAMQTALASAIAWIVANFPNSGGHLLCVSFNAQGQAVWDTFTSAQLSGLATQLTALSATIS